MESWVEEPLSREPLSPRLERPSRQAAEAWAPASCQLPHPNRRPAPPAPCHPRRPPQAAAALPRRHAAHRGGADGAPGPSHPLHPRLPAQFCAGRAGAIHLQPGGGFSVGFIGIGLPAWAVRQTNGQPPPQRVRQPTGAPRCGTPGILLARARPLQGTPSRWPGGAASHRVCFCPFLLIFHNPALG